MVSDGTDKYPMGTGGLYTSDVLNHTNLRTFEAVAEFIAQYVPEEVVCLETGTMYTWDPEVPYWNTTTALYGKVCRPKGGHLWSIDQEPNNEVLEQAFKAIHAPKHPDDIVSCTILKSDSVKGIEHLLKWYSIKIIDVLCLDSGEDPDMMVAEYEAARHHLAKNHYVLVDDIHNAGSVKYLKMVPMLKELGYDWVQVPTHTGLFVAAKGYPVPRK